MQFKQLLSFQDVASDLGCTADTVRTLVVEERSLPAVYVTLVGYKEPYSNTNLHDIDAQGVAFADLVGMSRHVGFVRIDRAALTLFKSKLPLEALASQPGERELGQRAESTYLTIVGALVDLMLNKTPGGNPQSVFANQAAIIDALVASYGNKNGIAKSTLEGKFAAARRHLNAQ
jgi:hypothetical protein